MTLDEAEKQAHEMLDALRREYELRAAPFITILSDIHAARPRVFYVPLENGKVAEMVRLALPREVEQRRHRVMEKEDIGYRCACRYHNFCRYCY